jgi:HEAT repeat protein
MKYRKSVGTIGPICLLLALTLSCKRHQSDAAVERVVRWANKFGIAIDSWQAGQLPTKDFDEEGSVAEGRALPDAERILLGLLTEPTERLEPVLAVRALGAVGSSASIPALAERAKDPWDVMRQEAIIALGRIGDPAGLTALADRVLYDERSSLRKIAARMLAKTGDSGSLEVMKTALATLRREQEVIEGARKELEARLSQKPEEPTEVGP